MLSSFVTHAYNKRNMPIQTTWYNHDFSPIAFMIGNEAVPWYWLNYLAGFIWCWFGLNLLNRNQSSPFPSDHTSREDLAAFAVWGWFGMIVGARLIYVTVYQWDWFFHHPDQMFALWNGGMSFHGGLLGIALSTWLVATMRRVSLLSFTDKLATLVPWPLATGRICNFINGELPGRPTDVAWAVLFPDPWHDFPRHPSQLYEAGAEGVLLGLIMAWAWPRWKSHPGACSALFLAGYGGLRFFTEFTREPDPQLGYLTGGFTMGQLLCLLMVAGAAVLARRVVNQSSLS